MPRRSSLWLSVLSVLSVPLWLLPSAVSAEPLPNTKPLTETGDLARKMVDGLHAYLDRELAAVAAARNAAGPMDRSAGGAARERLKVILGLTDRRLPPRLEYVSGPDEPAVVA